MDVKFNDKNINNSRKNANRFRNFILAFSLKGYKDKRISSFAFTFLE